MRTCAWVGDGWGRPFAKLRCATMASGRFCALWTARREREGKARGEEERGGVVVEVAGGKAGGAAMETSCCHFFQLSGRNSKRFGKKKIGERKRGLKE